MMTVMTRADGVVAQALLRNRWIIGLVMLHWAATALVMEGLGIAYDNHAMDSLTMLFGTLIPAFLFILLVWRAVCMLLYLRPAKPIAWLVADIRAVVLDRERLMDGGLTLVMLSIFFSNFSGLKEVIPQMNPFAWDKTFADMDWALHGGADVWTLLMPVMGAPLALAVLNGAYVGWIFLLYFMVFVSSFTRSNLQARQTFLVAFVLVWTLGGTIMATMFSSVGPVFYAPLGLGDRFEPLMQHLRAASEHYVINSLTVQTMLWDGYAAGKPVAGISAFPSMHVASSVLLAVYAFSYTRLAGILVSIFATMVFFAAVMLGWHYAVDGYVSVFLTLGCWKLAAWMTGGPRAFGARG